jgi:HEAT repeat protein
MARRRSLAVAAVLACTWAVAPAGARGGDPQVERASTALARDPSLKVRAQAALVLGQRGAREAVPALTRAVQEDASPAVRAAAAAALGRVGAPDAEPALRAASERDRDGVVRVAAARALEEVRRGVRAVVLEEVSGSAGDPSARDALREALTAQLQRRGFALVAADGAPGWRLKPAVLSVDVRHGAGALKVEVKASVIAVDGRGRIAAMVEGGARARSAGASPASAAPMTARAIEAAASSICDDLASRLLAME